MNNILPDLFWRKVEKTKSCWLWTGAIGSDGYGRFAVGRKTYLAHRISYILEIGPIPEGLHVDHVKPRCQNRHCVRPYHLEAVTQSENNRRMFRLGHVPYIAVLNSAKTACSNGHPFDTENTYQTKNGYRACRTCHRKWQRRYLNARQGFEASRRRR